VSRGLTALGAPMDLRDRLLYATRCPYTGIDWEAMAPELEELLSTVSARLWACRWQPRNTALYDADITTLERRLSALD
jgi:hypothetical protein